MIRTKSRPCATGKQAGHVCNSRTARTIRDGGERTSADAPRSPRSATPDHRHVSRSLGAWRTMGQRHAAYRRDEGMVSGHKAEAALRDLVDTLLGQIFSGVPVVDKASVIECVMVVGMQTTTVTGGRAQGVGRTRPGCRVRSSPRKLPGELVGCARGKGCAE